MEVYNMQVKHKIFAPILLLGFSHASYSDNERILNGIGHDGDIYRSYSIERFKWEENVDFQDRYFVKEDGFRVNISYGKDNNRRQDSGRLESINNTFNIGYVDYSGGALSHGVDELKSKTVYLGKDANIGLGYRHFVNDNHSFDIKGFLGINLWNRAILNRTVYSEVEEKDVKVGAYEFFIEGYAKAVARYNIHFSHSNQLSLEVGTDYPLQTWEYSNNTSKLLYPEPNFNFNSSITYYHNKHFFKAYYRDGKYDQSKTNSDGWYQPESDFEIFGLEYGFYF